jgi:hypothetical protein
MEIIQRGQERGNRWVYSNGFLACIPQIEVSEKFSRKEKKTVFIEKVNFIITS